MKVMRTLFVSSLTLLAACEGTKYRGDVGAMFLQFQGDVALQNANGTLVLHDNQNDLDRDLGLGDTEVSPYVRVQTDKDRHRVRAQYFGIDADGSGTLAGDYGGILAGTPVSTSMEFHAVGAAYSYGILTDQRYRLGIGGQLEFFSLDVAARSVGGREAVQTEVLVPMPYLCGEYYFGDFTLGADGSVMAADFGDAQGRFLDAEAYGRWQASERVDLMVGYRFLVMDAYGTATDRDFDSDIYAHGWFVTGGIRF